MSRCANCSSSRSYSCDDIQGARELATTAEQFRALAAAVERQRGAAEFPEQPIESTSAEQSTPAESSEVSLPVDMAEQPLETLQRCVERRACLGPRFGDRTRLF